MSLTTAQLTTLKTAILADATMLAMWNAGEDGALAIHLNGASSPIQNIWKPDVAPHDLAAGIDWAAFSALTVAKQNTYLALINASEGGVDATSANIRAGFVAVFGGASATVTALTAISQRVATRGEKIFTTGNVCAIYGYFFTDMDIVDARSLG